MFAEFVGETDAVESVSEMEVFAELEGETEGTDSVREIVLLA